MSSTRFSLALVMGTVISLAGCLADPGDEPPMDTVPYSSASGGEKLNGDLASEAVAAKVDLYATTWEPLKTASGQPSGPVLNLLATPAGEHTFGYYYRANTDDMTFPNPNGDGGVFTGEGFLRNAAGDLNVVTPTHGAGSDISDLFALHVAWRNNFSAKIGLFGSAILTNTPGLDKKYTIEEAIYLAAEYLPVDRSQPPPKNIACVRHSFVGGCDDPFGAIAKRVCAQGRLEGCDIEFRSECNCEQDRSNPENPYADKSWRCEVAPGRWERGILVALDPEDLGPYGPYLERSGCTWGAYE
jgi:hypothetical protein